MPDAIFPATIVFPIFNFVLRTVQTGYELASVPAETNDYLKTVTQVLTDIQTARTLRRDKVALLNHEDLIRVDSTIKGTEEAMTGLEKLIERARVDMSVNHDSVGPGARFMWVMRDQHKVGAAMNRLTIASQSLHGEILMMRLAGIGLSNPYSTSNKPISPPPSPWSQTSGEYSPPPPSYLQDTLNEMKERREWVARRYSINRPLSRSSTPAQQPYETVPSSSMYPQTPPTPSSSSEHSTISTASSNVVEYIRENEATLASMAPSLSITPQNDILLATEVDREEVLHPRPRPEASRARSVMIELEGGAMVGATSGPLGSAMGDYSLQSPSRSTSRTSSQSRSQGSTQNASQAPSQSRPYSLSAPQLVSRTTNLAPPTAFPFRTQSSGGGPPHAVTGGSSSSRATRRPSPALAARSTPRSATSESRTSSSSRMQSTTLIPGQRRRTEITWHEPVEEEAEEAQTPSLRENERILNSTPPPEDPPPSYSFLDSELSAASGAAAPDVARTRTRRRAPRVYAVPEPPSQEAVTPVERIRSAPAEQPTRSEPALQATRSLSSRHNVISRGSRTDWALDQQLGAARRTNSR